MPENSKPRYAKATWWREVMAEQSASGKSVSAFCRERGISRDSFQYWRKRFASSQREGRGKNLPSRFVAVSDGGYAATTISHSPRIALPNGVIIDLGAGVDSPFARQLLMNLCGIGGTHAKS